MLCGSGSAAALAQHGAALMVGRFERERPGSAALAVDAASARCTRSARRATCCWRSAAAVPAPALAAAVQAAQAKDMTVVALTGRDAGDLREHGWVRPMCTSPCRTNARHASSRSTCWCCTACATRWTFN